MYKILIGLVLFLTFPALLYGQGGDFLLVHYPKMYEENGKKYPVELVYTQNDGWIKLRIRFDTDKWNKDQALAFLAREVNSLTTGERVSVGEGYFFTFTGARAVWEPRRDFSQKTPLHWLRFTTAGSVAGKEIFGIGQPNVTGNVDFYARYR